MGEFIQSAGYAIYPILLFGLMSIGVASRYAIAPSRSMLALVIGFAVVTVLLGCLGTVVGMQVSAQAIPEVPDRPWIFLLGMRESLNNMVAALLVAMIDAMLATVGAHRTARAEERRLAPA